jgi:hypothetical protein
MFIAVVNYLTGYEFEFQPQLLSCWNVTWLDRVHSPDSNAIRAGKFPLELMMNFRYVQLL